MARVALRSVTKAWSDTVAVRGIDLEVSDGSFTAILGPSGCGKSTTLLMLAGIYRPTAGDILFDDARVNEVEPRERNVGIVFQSYALYPNMSVLENIRFPLGFQRLGGDEAGRRARHMAELMQIAPLLERRPGQLSGGQQQRVALARALVKRPGLLLLDEPLSNLDAALRLTMRAVIRRIQRSLGVTTLLVTHDQLEATTMADRIVVMNAGRIEQVGTAEDLYRRPASLFVAGFVGTPPMNLLPARSDGTALLVGDHALVLPSHTAAATFGLRPEALRFCDTQGSVPALISHVEPMGREVLYTADSPLGPLRVLEAGAEARYREGDAIPLAWSVEDAFIFAADGARIDTRVAAHA